MHFDSLIENGWHLCTRNYTIKEWWNGFLLMRCNKSILVLEKDVVSSHITADLIGPQLLLGFKLFYGHINEMGHIKDIYRWRYCNRIKTIYL